MTTGLNAAAAPPSALARCGPVRLVVPLLLGCLAGSPGAALAAVPVEAELAIPPAETWVIGDELPLLWRFKNVSNEPLAFMWEGCCRLNGRLTVTRAAETLPPLPPGQALAHMFAKAERLEPGVARDFETRLSDWVRLTDSGTYTLSGRYTGVLPDQQPQVPKGLRLWREAATTLPTQVAVLSVSDYLAQRDARQARRHTELSLAGPSALPPLQPVPLRLRIHNRGAAPQRLAWPDDLSLWIVDRAGRRVTAGGTAIAGTFEEITLAPGAHLERDIPLGSERLEGEPFGAYRVFVDLAHRGDDRPRLPSNPIELRWDLTRDQVADLVRAAAAPRSTARNAPLRLVRVYLAELRGVLDRLSLAGEQPEETRLLRELRLAACLKGFAPKPGRVDWPVAVAASGRWRLDDEGLTRCAPDEPGTNALAALLGVKRHLGWEVGLVLRPEPSTPLGALLQASAELGALAGPLALAPRAVADDRALNTTNLLATGSVLFVTNRPPASLVFRHRPARAGNGATWEYARRAPDPQQPQRPAAFTADEIAATRFEPLPDAASLRAVLDHGEVVSPQVLLLADRSTAWEVLRAFVEPMLQRGWVVRAAANPSP